MKKLSKPIFVILLAGILLLSATINTFATDCSDPIGKSSAPKYGIVRND